MGEGYCLMASGFSRRNFSIVSPRPTAAGGGHVWFSPGACGLMGEGNFGGFRVVLRKFSMVSPADRLAYGLALRQGV